MEGVLLADEVVRKAKRLLDVDDLGVLLLGLSGRNVRWWVVRVRRKVEWPLVIVEKCIV